MKIDFKSLILVLTGVLAMTACSNEIDDQLSGGDGNVGQEVKFTVGIENLSRTAIADGALTTTFASGDEIGIFAYNGDKAVASNVKYTYDGSTWSAENAITSDGSQLKYYAYYPYMDGVTDPSAINVTVNADQTGGFSKDDVLTAQNTTAQAGATSVSLNFTHAFAMVQVGIKNGVTTDTEATVALESIQPTAVINAKEGTVGAASGEKTSIKMQKTSADKWVYRAIVPAQELASGSKLLTVVASGKTYTVTYSSTNGETVSYEKGKALQITINALNALPEGNEVTIGGSITDWESGTSNPGEGDITEVPVESLDLSGFTGFAELQALSGWSKDKVTGKSSFWFKRETTSGLVTYKLTESGELSMTLLQGEARATWNSNSIGYHSGAKFDHTKKYTLTFTARAENTESGNNIGVALLNSSDTKLFCKDDLTGTLHTGGVTNTEKTYAFTFDFSQSSTAAKATFDKEKGEGGSATTEDEAAGGINIVFFNNTNTKSMSSASTLYVKDVKLNMVKE